MSILLNNYQEMLVRNQSVKKCELEQLDLFQTRPARPSLQSLPTKARVQATKLLAQLIVEHVSKQLEISDQKELIDE